MFTGRSSRALVVLVTVIKDSLPVWLCLSVLENTLLVESGIIYTLLDMALSLGVKVCECV